MSLILVDSFDFWQMEVGLGETFAGLMDDRVELHMEERLILPNLKMQGEAERCGFLNQDGRCGIHAFRPGLCRLYPLGRSYEGRTLKYFLLEEACPNGGTKVKVRKWLEVPDSRNYTDFLIKWHDLRKTLQEELACKEAEEPELMKERNMRFLHIFYEETYEPGDFYGQFEERICRFRKRGACG